jgi:hypothetical protein
VVIDEILSFVVESPPIVVLTAPTAEPSSLRLSISFPLYVANGKMERR